MTEGGLDPDPGPYYLLLPDDVRSSEKTLTGTNVNAAIRTVVTGLDHYPATVDGDELPTVASIVSPRLAASGASAAERAGRRAEQQMMRERLAQHSESRSLDRAVSAVYGAISQRSPRWQHRPTATGFR